jgi:hypothetical protein
MKSSILIIAFIFTVVNLVGQVLPISARRAEKKYSIAAHQAIATAKKTIEIAKQQLIEELKKEANKAIKDGNIKYADNILARIKELKARDKVDDFFGKATIHKNNFSVIVENACPCSAVELNAIAKPWLNRKYRFLNIPSSLTGKKFFPYKAKSKTGVTLVIKKNCLVRVIVGRDKDDSFAIPKWEKEGWKRERINNNFGFNNRGKGKFAVLTRLAKQGQKIRMNDYSKFAGIIVLAN